MLLRICAIPLLVAVLATSTADPGVTGLETDDSRERNAWFFSQRSYPTGSIPFDARRDAFETRRIAMGKLAKTRDAATSPASSRAWISAGPRPISHPVWGSVTGRITTLAVSPADATVVLLGSAAGGIWRSGDRGETWTPVSDGQIDAAVGSIAFAQSDPSIVYAGMGDPNGYLGTGILKSHDGGRSWNRIISAGLPAGFFCSRIQVDPSDARRVYAASPGMQADNGFLTGNGVFVSTDSGASWTETISGTPRDLVISPADPRTLYVSMQFIYDCCNKPGGVYRSRDGGMTWALVLTSLYDPYSLDIKLAVTPAAPAALYVLSGGVDRGLVTMRLTVTTDSGATWTTTPLSLDTTQFGYNSYIAADAADAKLLYIGTTMLFRSTDGGTNWTNLTGGYDVNVSYSAHVDQHAIAFSPGNSPREIYIGNDGGVFKSTDRGNTFRALNGTLALVQAYSVAIDPSQTNVLYAGTQDNSLVRNRIGDTSWDPLPTLGEGKDIVIHPGGVVFFSDIRCLIVRLTNGIMTQVGSNDAFGESSSPRVAWTAPLVGNGRDATLYFGTWRLFKSVNEGATWTKPAGDLDLTAGIPADGGAADVLTAIAVAPDDPQVLYTGSSQGRAMTSSDAGTTWTDISSGLPKRFITSIAVDKRDARTVWLTLSGFRSSHVFRSSTGGQTWIDATTGLPDVPVNAIVQDPVNPGVMYAGNDVGVYAWYGSSWASFDNGMPPTVIMGLAAHPSGGLAAATYGRGVFLLGPLVSWQKQRVVRH